jgi:hypothetical protein
MQLLAAKIAVAKLLKYRNGSAASWRRHQLFSCVAYMAESGNGSLAGRGINQ